MTNQKQRPRVLTSQEKEEILALARQVLTGERRIAAAACELTRYWDAFTESTINTELKVFFMIDDENFATPIGDVRRHWSSEALRIEDRKIAESEERWRAEAVEAAARLIRMLEPGPT